MSSPTTGAEASGRHEPDDEHALELADHLRRHASGYFPGLTGQVEVRLVRADDRPFAALYWYELTNGVGRRGVIVKVSRRRAPQAARHRRPARARPTPMLLDPRQRFEVEASSLRAAERHFGSLVDDRFGAIRLLATLPDRRAIVMERVDNPTLLALTISPTHRPMRWPVNGLAPAFTNAGAWLREYQRLPVEHPVSSVHADAREWLRFVVDGIVGHLANTLGFSPLLDAVAHALERGLRRHLPERLPLGLGHGDFAMRNILVGTRGRVTVLDILARSNVPRYQDVGAFLAGMRTAAPQLLSQGVLVNHRRIDAYEEAFLRGYAGSGSIPWGAVRTFELAALADRWASKRSYPVVSRLPPAIGIRLIDRVYRRRIARIVGELERD